MSDTQTRLDGNVLSGILSELFVVDMTRARTTCAHCRNVGMVAELHVYAQAPGTVARCSTCDGVQLRVVAGGGRWWLDLSGIRCVEIAKPAAS